MYLRKEEISNWPDRWAETAVDPGRSVQVSHVLFTFLPLICCGETGDCFLEQIPKNKRSKPIMESLILKRIRLGTKILTDGHLSYRGLERLGNLQLL